VQACSKRQGLNRELTLPRARFTRGCQGQAALLYHVGGGSYWWLASWPLKRKGCQHSFKSGTLASSLMDVPTVLALQKSEEFLRASRADIKELLGMEVINWGRVCPGAGGSLQPSLRYP